MDRRSSKDIDLEKRFQNLKRDNDRMPDSSRFKKEKSPDYDFKIEDKFEKRYPKIDQEYTYKVEDLYDYKKKSTGHDLKRIDEDFRNRDQFISDHSNPAANLT